MKSEQKRIRQESNWQLMSLKGFTSHQSPVTNYGSGSPGVATMPAMRKIS
jgi:hypothetical protein